MTSVAAGTLARGQVTPRPVFCAIAHEHHDRGVAEDVCAGRFTNAGITLELGVEPDWLSAALPPDEEWRIEWSKLYCGLDLASAFGETGEIRFLRAWERLVGSWMRQVPIGSDTSDVAARRIQNWIYAWQGFASSPRFPGLADGLDERLLDHLGREVGYVRANLTPERNHRTLELYALFLAALALPLGEELLGFAISELNEALFAEFRPDGVHRESSTDYHMIALRSFVAARENARRFGIDLPGGFDAHLERACEFAMHCRRPDGLIPALSDADTGSFAELLELASGLLGRPDLAYAASSGARGTPPARSCASFPDGGYFVQRSGWGEGATPLEQERFLIFDCGPLGDGGHGHYDLLSFEMAAGGRPLIVDPGRYTYSEHGENMRRWFKGTSAHNTVCVDGLDQTPYRRGRPAGAVAEGRFLGRASAPGLDLLAGEASSPCYEAVHQRRIVFVAGEYWIIEDRLRAECPHRYDLRFHLMPEASGATSLARCDDAVAARAPGLALVVAPALEARIEPGWVSPAYGVKLEAPVVSFVADGDPEAVLTTLVMPLDAGSPTPSLRVLRRDAAASVTIVEVGGVGRGGAGRDVVTFGPHGAPLALERRPGGAAQGEESGDPRVPGAAR